MRSSHLRGVEGFSSLEMLVGMGLAGALMAAAVPFATTTMRMMSKQDVRVEVRQGLRATLDNVVRDLRLTGGCLPSNGRFIALAGVDGGTEDQITIRSGIADPALGCVSTALATPVAAGVNVLDVDLTSGFETGQVAYLRHLDGNGEFFVITAVNEAGATVTRSGTTSRAFPIGSGLFAVDERVYALDTTGPGPPILTIDVNRTGPVPFAAGVTALNFRYVLDRNCPSCDVVDQPADDVEWWVVRGLEATVTVEAVNPPRPTDAYAQTRTVRARPRNLSLGG